MMKAYLKCSNRRLEERRSCDIDVMRSERVCKLCSMIPICIIYTPKQIAE